MQVSQAVQGYMNTGATFFPASETSRRRQLLATFPSEAPAPSTTSPHLTLARQTYAVPLPAPPFSGMHGTSSELLPCPPIAKDTQWVKYPAQVEAVRNEEAQAPGPLLERDPDQ